MKKLKHIPSSLIFRLLLIQFVFVILACCNKDNSNPHENNQNDSVLVIHGPVDSNTNEPTDTSLLSRNQYLYVSLDNKKQIAVYKIDSESGNLALIEKKSVNGSPGSLSCSQNKKYLYAALRSTNEVATFSIDKEKGKLNFIKNTAVADNPVYIIPDKTNKYLLTAYWSGNKVAIYPITGDSIVEEQAVQEFDPGINPHCIINSEDNKYTYVAVMTSGNVNQYSFNETTGKITALDPAMVELGEDIGPRHIDIHPNGKWAYIVNEINNTVYAYIVDQGKLTKFDEINTLPPSFTKFSKCSDIHITPGGKYVYAANRGHNSIAAFKINQSDGKLTLIDQYETEPNPREFEIDQTGNFLYAGGEDSGNIAVYRVKEDGSLLKLKVYGAGERVTWLMTLRL